jgi:hypothetical protein
VADAAALIPSTPRRPRWLLGRRYERSRLPPISAPRSAGGAGWLSERHDVRGSHQVARPRTKDDSLEGVCLDGLSGLVRAVYGQARSGLMRGPRLAGGAQGKELAGEVWEGDRDDARLWSGMSCRLV